MVGFPSTMSSSSQHTPLRAIFPIDSEMTSNWPHGVGPTSSADRIAENEGVMPVRRVSAGSGPGRQAA